MLNALKRLFSIGPLQEAHHAYIGIVNQARQPHFYERYHVADTLDGRFDVIALHLSLAVDSLRHHGTPESLEFSRVLMEVFFSDMDRSLREMGVGDTGISHRIRKMAQALYGRLKAYEDNLQDEQALKQALARNLYRGGPADESALAALASYMQRNSAQLRSPDAIARLIGGEISFIA